MLLFIKCEICITQRAWPCLSLGSDTPDTRLLWPHHLSPSQISHKLISIFSRFPLIPPPSTLICHLPRVKKQQKINPTGSASLFLSAFHFYVIGPTRRTTRITVSRFSACQNIPSHSATVKRKKKKRKLWQSTPFTSDSTSCIFRIGTHSQRGLGGNSHILCFLYNSIHKNVDPFDHPSNGSIG